MTVEQAYNDLKDIFSKPCEFSTTLDEGEKYITYDNGHNSIIVSKKWGYWAVVMDTLIKYFDENGNIDNHGAVIPSKTDIIGTVIDILTKEEYYERVSGTKCAIIEKDKITNIKYK